MSNAFILLGSNMGDKKNMLLNAVIDIKKIIGDIITKSSIYETEPWEVDGFQESYLNQVIQINTNLTAKNLLLELNKIEVKYGRHREIKNSSRTLDLDILFFENQIINSNDLTIPHPRLHLRNFTLIPLMEIAPYFIHPKLNKNIEELYDECKDPSEVILLENE